MENDIDLKEVKLILIEKEVKQQLRSAGVALQLCLFRVLTGKQWEEARPSLFSCVANASPLCLCSSLP